GLRNVLSFPAVASAELQRQRQFATLAKAGNSTAVNTQQSFEVFDGQQRLHGARRIGHVGGHSCAALRSARPATPASTRSGPGRLPIKLRGYRREAKGSWRRSGKRKGGKARGVRRRG